MPYVLFLGKLNRINKIESILSWITWLRWKIWRSIENDRVGVSPWGYVGEYNQVLPITLIQRFDSEAEIRRILSSKNIWNRFDMISFSRSSVNSVNGVVRILQNFLLKFLDLNQTMSKLFPAHKRIIQTSSVNYLVTIEHGNTSGSLKISSLCNLFENPRTHSLRHPRLQIFFKQMLKRTKVLNK